MKINYSKANISQGRVNQSKAEEQPNTFSTENGVDQVTQMGNLDVPKQRMAGQMGHRVMEYLNDPNERSRTDSWMSMFGLSNEGMMYNQAKLGGAPPA